MRKFILKNEILSKYYFFSVFVFSFFSLSCKKSSDRECFKSNGKIVTENRDVVPFDSLYIEDEINLFITQDSFYSIVVKAPGNLINFIETKIEVSELKIKNRNKCNFLRSYKYEMNVYITVVNLSSIYFIGSGKIATNNIIKIPYFKMNVNGASGSVNLLIDSGTSYSILGPGTADVTISGNSGVSYVYLAGVGPLYLQGLNTGYSYVRNEGVGDIFLNVTKELGVEIFSLGSVYYTGEPYSITSDIRGQGKLVKQN